MSAFALYPSGRSGEAFAKVSTHSLVACFGAMAAEVHRWLPSALGCGEDATPPRAIELTLEWNGAAPQPSPVPPVAPSDPARQAPRPAGRSVRCVARRRLACPAGPGFAAPATLRDALA
ncbi:MAG TPA: hypothetical protein VF245_00845 [Solirubrobacterales bacterium]